MPYLQVFCNGIQMNWISFSVGCGRAVISVLLSAVSCRHTPQHEWSIANPGIQQASARATYNPTVMHAEMPCALLMLLQCKTSCRV